MANKTTQKLPPEELSLFCDQVSMILAAGIPLYDGMETLAASYRDTRYGDRFAEIYLSLVQCGRLADALVASGMFPQYLTGMVRIGEQAGKLDEVLAALARYYAWEAELRQSIRSAVVYPVVLMCMLAVVVAILMVSVLPVFTRVFESLGMNAADSQSSLMELGTGIGKGALIAIGVVLVFMAVFSVGLRTRGKEKYLSLAGALMPPVREVRTKLSAGRFANVLSIMLTAGGSVESALELAQDISADPAYAKRISRCAEALDKGDTFAAASGKAKLFEPMHQKMLEFGSAAGKLDQVTASLAETYEQDADDTIHYLVSLIEPTLVAVLTVVMGGILLSVTLPLLSLLSAMA